MATGPGEVEAEEGPGVHNADELQYTNHLTGETSPYLLLHAHNPVEWYPWGEEAIGRARAEDKPIFCRWGIRPVIGAT